MSVLDAAVTFLLAMLHLAGLRVALLAAARAHTAQGGLAWTLALVFVPALALPAYAVFGPPNPSRLAPDTAARRAVHARYGFLAGALPGGGASGEGVADVLERLAPLPRLPCRPPSLLVDGEATFAAIFAAVDGARREVAVQFYIVRDDPLGRRLRDRLAARAAEGVRVRVLLDSIGSRGLSRAFWRPLRAAGGEVLFFRIAPGLGRLLHLNHRNHRKLVTADGEVAIVGGFNAGEEYLGRDRRIGPWRDTAISLQGTCAAAVEAAFLEDWLRSGGTVCAATAPLAAAGAKARADEAAGPPPVTAAGDRARPCAERAGEVPALVLPTGPGDRLPALTLSLCHLIGEARERLWIASPYFVPDLDVMTSLKLAALRGVDVRVLIPDRPDHLLVWLAAFAYADDAEAAGVSLWRYRPGFMHQKVVLVDERTAAVGTVNLDNRSLRQNFEITVVVRAEAFAREVRGMLEADLARSVRHPERAFPPARARAIAILAPAARLLGPQL